ncbi:hypothetical protein ACFOZ7_05580 [Natribaculum luteum]|uniref:GLUG domain-containing protein n=1 Tax=Natribaculum luteum TaxID=1586232 RepID=A0ABD5NWJ2_9EURY|nr:hypothetical protein [Natribaculum luteum]
MTTRISTYEELQSMSDPSGHYELVDDIDATGKSEWTLDIFGEPFTGVFDGNGHTIKGLTGPDGPSPPQTFLSTAREAEIRNLTLENISFSGEMSSVLLGEAVHCRIDNVHVVDADLEGSYAASGLIMATIGDTLISDCSVRNTTVTTGTEIPAGGFVGAVGVQLGETAIEGTVRIEGCSFDGTLKSSATATTSHGGFVGEVGDGVIHRCSAKGTIDSDVEGVGGFVGSARGLISCCSWEGDIYATGGATGGFVNNNAGEILSCYARGGELVGGNNTGGFVNEHTGDIDQCYTALASRVEEGSSRYAAFVVHAGGTAGDAWDADQTTMPDAIYETADGVHFGDSAIVGLESDQLKGTELWSRIVDEWDLNSHWTPVPNEYLELQANFTIPVDSLDDLDTIRDLPGADYELVNDIDASPTQEWNENAFGTPQGFEPIPELHGTLDGNGYEIDGFYIDRDETAGVGLFTELFGYVRDLTVTNAYIRGADTLGTIAANLSWQFDELGIPPRIRNVVVESELVSTPLNDTGHLVGGIAGFAETGIFSQCHADVTIDASGMQAGGILAMGVSDSESIDSELVECSSTGTISAESSRVGGIVGDLQDYYASNDTGWLVSDCYSTASVSSTADTEAIVGGVIGYAYALNSDLHRVFAAGELSSGSGDAGGVIGSIVEESSELHIGSDKNVYWDGEATGVTVAVGKNGSLTDATELTTAEMTGPDAVDNLTGFDFGTVWVQEYEEYPSLTAFSLGSALYSGYVTDVDGVPVEGAAVETDSLTLWARTDADGYYEIVGPVVIDFDLVSLSGAVSKEAVPNTEVDFQFGGIKVILKDPATGRPLEDIIIQIGEYYARTDSQGEVRIPTIPPQTRYDVVAFEQFERRAWVAEEGDLFVVDFTDELEEKGPSFGDVAILEFEVIDERSNPIHETTATVDVFGAITESNRDGKLMVPVPTHGDLDPTIIFADGDPRYRTRRLDVEPGEDPDIGNLILREKTHSVNH